MHLIAKTYGKLPSELLRLSWADYQFCVAALMASLEDDNGKRPARPVNFDWSDIAT